MEAVAFNQDMQPTGEEEETKCNWKADTKGGYLGLGRSTSKACRGSRRWDVESRHRREKNISKVLPEKRERERDGSLAQEMGIIRTMIVIQWDY